MEEAKAKAIHLSADKIEEDYWLEKSLEEENESLTVAIVMTISHTSWLSAFKMISMALFLYLCIALVNLGGEKTLALSR